MKELPNQEGLLAVAAYLTHAMSIGNPTGLCPPHDRDEGPFPQGQWRPSRTGDSDEKHELVQRIRDMVQRSSYGDQDALLYLLYFPCASDLDHDYRDVLPSGKEV